MEFVIRFSSFDANERLSYECCVKGRQPYIAVFITIVALVCIEFATKIARVIAAHLVRKNWRVMTKFEFVYNVNSVRYFRERSRCKHDFKKQVVVFPLAGKVFVRKHAHISHNLCAVELFYSSPFKKPRIIFYGGNLDRVKQAFNVRRKL